MCNAKIFKVHKPLVFHQGNYWNKNWKKKQAKFKTTYYETSYYSIEVC